MLDNIVELPDSEKERAANAGMGHRVGIGQRPALLIVDVQIYMMGDKREPIEESTKKYPSSCGLAAWDAVEQVKKLVDVFREQAMPVIYTYLSLKKDGSDAGPFKMKREFLKTDCWMIEGTHGAEICPLIKPQEADFVFPKKRPSAFFGTPLQEYLQAKDIDTLVVVGGSTSNCVRATVFDSASYDYHTILPSDALIDRMPTSHEVNLWDMDRQFADVMTTNEIIAALQKLQVE